MIFRPLFLLSVRTTCPTHSDAAARGKRKSDNKRALATEPSEEDKPANWRRVKEAGVAFWVNDVTGVATDECPHESLRPVEDTKRSMPRCTEGGTSEGRSENGQDEGTGALVYDSSEFEQAMQILDDDRLAGSSHRHAV